MNIGFWSEEERVKQVCNKDQEEDGGVDVPALEDMLELGLEPLKQVAVSYHGV